MSQICSEKTTALKVVILFDHFEKAMKMVDENIIFEHRRFLTKTVELALKFLKSPVSSIQLGVSCIKTRNTKACGTRQKYNRIKEFRSEYFEH